jgi:hypothetical protein
MMTWQQQQQQGKDECSNIREGLHKQDGCVDTPQSRKLSNNTRLHTAAATPLNSPGIPQHCYACSHTHAW